MTIRFILNDRDVAIDRLSPSSTLLDYLRIERRLTGSKEGCAEGDCGACTVLVGRLVRGKLVYETVNACIRFTASLNATHVVTIEHLAAKDGTLHPVQQAMVDLNGSQCGFCTPGIVMSLYALWMENEKPSRRAIEKALQGNLCRCTGYEPIIKAAEAASAHRPDPAFDAIARERDSVMTRLAALKTGETIVVGDETSRAIIPGSVAALAETLSEYRDATIIAGSTDVGLWVTKQMRKLNPMVFINHLEELQTITETDDTFIIGAGVTYSEAPPALAGKIPALASLLDRLGGEQVRNMGTIGGNVANGSPIGDTPPALIALGATLTLQSAEGHRSISLQDYFLDYGKQDRRPGEFVLSITVPKLSEGSRYEVYKISKRREEDISAVCGAFFLKLADDGTAGTIRIAFGGMAGIPKRASRVEAALAGKPWTMETIEAARAAFESDFTPMTDMRATAEYRMLSAKNLLTRFFLETGGERHQLSRFETEEA
ncbi:xanthine dehydrogenase small subunit [Martelella endophytica]|uniref:FAD-binding molybdopterin dehydrogenase n=1 Tax=Martelella endophytica TaxID=1486262 RepID=A0A0D5LL99_MAREN|nr:xanthine dehydrogenase small subunit [Martelella endophytica]AJY44745.1 FAD-binding molybdopterin dehydrogenase [Martelella endophytica]